jgi:hypothetical protein
MNRKLEKKLWRIAGKQLQLTTQELWQSLLAQPLRWRLCMAWKLIKGPKIPTGQKQGGPG